MLVGQDHVYVKIAPVQQPAIMVADIGGTNSNFGICYVQQEHIILYASWHIKSVHITDPVDVFVQAYNHFTERYNIRIASLCIAAAGIVNKKLQQCKPTNLSFTIDCNAIKQQLPDLTMYLINDFEAVAYGYPYIDQKALVPLQAGEQRPYQTRAILGAGTGLGKVLLTWDGAAERYFVHPSEGGHADIAIDNTLEWELLQFVKQDLACDYPISWENLISGHGIQRIYSFFGGKNHYEQTTSQERIAKAKLNPDQIFALLAQDKRCADTVELFMRLYGRCAKNYALETLPLGGLYIAGGIATHNVAVMGRSGFMQEFKRSCVHAPFLSSIPITIISDYNVSLFGGAAYVAYYA